MKLNKFILSASQQEGVSYLSKDLEWFGCEGGALRGSSFKGKGGIKIKLNQRVTVKEDISTCAWSQPALSFWSSNLGVKSFQKCDWKSCLLFSDKLCRSLRMAFKNFILIYGKNPKAKHGM